MENETDMYPRDRILQAAMRLLTEGGREAVASHGFATYLVSKRARETHPDPVENLRRGWNLHIDFGLANPALYTLMYSYPRRITHPAVAEALEMLCAQVRRVAEAGRLCVSVERAANMIHAAAVGVVLVLLGQGGARADQTLAVATREAVLAANTADPQTVSPHARPAPRSDVTRHAVALKASFSQDARPFTPT